MIKNDKHRPPKIIHKNTRSEEGKFGMMFVRFMEVLRNKAIRQIRSGEISLGYDPDETLDVSGERLLALRKELVAAVKEGMIERKDQEEKIALLAALVWFHRQDVEEKARMLSSWG